MASTFVPKHRRQPLVRAIRHIAYDRKIISILKRKYVKFSLTQTSGKLAVKSAWSEYENRFYYQPEFLCRYDDIILTQKFLIDKV